MATPGVTERQKEIAQALQDIRTRQWDCAEERLLRLMPSEETAAIVGEFDFCTPLDEAWLRYTLPRRPVARSRNRFYEVYQLYAFVLVERQRFKDALGMLKRAADRNPAALPPQLERLDIMKRLRVRTGFLEQCMACFERAWLRKDVAHCYRNYAWWFVENEQWTTAIACIMRSMEWDIHPRAQQELLFIGMRSGRRLEKPNAADITDLLHEAGVPNEPRSLWVEIAVEMARHARDESRPREALQFFQVAYNLQPYKWLSDEMRDLHDAQQP